MGLTIEFTAIYFKTALVLGTVLAVLSLPAICAAVSRGHWFPRAAVTAGFLALLMPTRAYEPIVMTMAYTLAVAFAMSLVRYLTNWRQRAAEGQRGLPRIRFSLRDLLLLTLVVAALTAIATYSFRHFIDFTWWKIGKIVLHGLGLSVVALATAWLTLGRGWLWLRIVAVLIALGVSALTISFCNIWLFSDWQHAMVNVAKTDKLFCLVTAATELLLLLSCLVLLRLSGLFNLTREACTKTLGWRKLRLTARVASFSVVVAMLVPSGFLYWRLSRPLPSFEVNLPNPNGYPTLSELGKKYDNINFPSPLIDPPSAFVAFSKKQHPALRSAHETLQLPCRVPLTYTLGKNFVVDFTIEHLGDMHALAYALFATAEGKRIDGEFDEAIDYSLDCLLLGKQIQHGGLGLDWTVGFTIDQLGREPLCRMHNNLSAQQCRRVITALLEIEKDRELLADAMRRDKAMERCTDGWQIDFYYAAKMLVGEHEDDYYETRLREIGNRHVVLTRLLMVELAIRAYRLEHRALPINLDNLVSEYLPGEPRDPFAEGEKPLIYRLADEGYLLYSVGHNGRDDGGKKVSWLQSMRGEGDIFIDTVNMKGSSSGQPWSAAAGNMEQDTTDD